MKKFKIVEKFKGYRTKTDPTKIPQGYLVSGSQNVLSTDSDNIKSREGYTLFGQANANGKPILSSFDWDTNSGTQRNLRSYEGELEVYEPNTNTWVSIKSSWASANFQYAVWWDDSKDRDILLFVNGDANIYSWQGLATQIGVTTANTIQLLNTASTWTEQRATSTGTITINGTVYTYTGGATTNTLTGVTPDPTGEASGSVATGPVTTNSNKPGSDATLFSNDLIAVLNNLVWIGSTKNHSVYVSKNTSFTDFTYSSPRLPGEGAILTLDGIAVGFAVQEQDMYISAGGNQWYQSRFTLSSDNTKEDLAIIRLKTGELQSAYSQNAIAKAKNQLFFMSKEPTFDSLGRVENFDTPQANPISDPIKPDFDNADLTNIDTKFFRNNVYISLPAEGKVYIYNMERAYWEAPQVLPIRKFSIINGELYGHSSNTAETYKLFDGYSDNANSIKAVANFSYQNFGDRVALKVFDEHYSEGRIRSNTVLSLKIRYESDGFGGIKKYKIDGNDKAILFGVNNDNSLGKVSIGKEPIGSTTNPAEFFNKFRQINTINKIDFYEIQVSYESDQIDGAWEILAFGQNISAATSLPNSIKK